MKVEEIIEKDKVREVREDFYNGIMKKMARNKMDDAGPVIRKRHLGMSIAAGIALASRACNDAVNEGYNF